jgi:Uncharacterized conserved protein
MNPEIIGLTAGLFTTAATIPQILKSYKTKSVGDISLTMYASLVIGMTLWLIYGFFINSLSVIFWNIAALSLNLTILIQKLHYDSKNRKAA